MVQKAKVEAIKRVLQLILVSWFWGFLGLENYFWQFVKRFSKLSKPLTQFMTKLGQEWDWRDEEEQTFQELKDLLSFIPIWKWLIHRWPFSITYQLKCAWAWNQIDSSERLSQTICGDLCKSFQQWSGS
jgi:hypothetical protein